MGFSASYALQNVTAAAQPQYGATAPTVSNVQQDIKAHKAGSKTDSAVQTTVDKYLQEKP
jgi:hypothetical protein